VVLFENVECRIIFNHYLIGISILRHFKRAEMSIKFQTLSERPEYAEW
jgi:hypothetical protein